MGSSGKVRRRTSRDILRRRAWHNPYGFPLGVNRAGFEIRALVCAGLELVVASGRTSGVVKNTPSGVGFGVGVMDACGDPATPLRSWIRINSAKSSCTVLW